MSRKSVAPQRIVIVGLGTIAQSFLPLLSKVHDLKALELYAIDPVIPPLAVYFEQTYGLIFIQTEININNVRDTLVPILDDKTFLINLSTDVSSLELIKICRSAGALYLDTCIEPWRGGYDNPEIPLNQRTNYHLREQMLDLKRKLGKGPTALVAHGANPGLVSHFLKRALINLSKEILNDDVEPKTRSDWAALSQRLGVQAIHIAEYDSQRSTIPNGKGEFVNTWSVNGFISEAQQPAELGWGTHEPALPENAAQHEQGCKAAIYIQKPGATVKVKTWTPYDGACLGFVVTHNEAISIADYLTVEHDEVTYRPTVHYAYRPSDDAILSLHEWLGKNCQEPERKKVLRPAEIDSGSDYLGVLLMGHAKQCYWYGSILCIEEAKRLSILNTATTLQVAAGVLSGYLWVLNNSQVGIIEAEEMDHEEVLSYVAQFLGDLKGYYSDWNPTKYDPGTFKVPDVTNPWAFTNFTV